MAMSPDKIKEMLAGLKSKTVQPVKTVPATTSVAVVEPAVPVDAAVAVVEKLQAAAVVDKSAEVIKQGPGSEITHTVDSLALLDKIEDLRAAIHEAHPRMPMLLREIHQVLKKDDQLVTLLSEDMIGVVVQGLCKQSNIELVTAAASTKPSKNKLKGVTSDMV